ncbi:MAG: GAF domain-containing protein [Rhodoglobus sp.]
MQHELSFPDGPRSDLDDTLARLVRDAQQVLETQGRLRSLLKATRVVAGELELAEVLQRIIEAAVELVGARYGAIGVIAPDGTLEQFIHVGMPSDTVSRIGHLPEGHGLLGALIDEQEPIRLDRLADDPRSVGFPAGHPPMESFLGVPVRVGDEVYGNLYLSESSAGAFSAEDQELLVALAATAGGAIDHARLFDETRRRQRWAAALADATAALLSEEVREPREVVAERVLAVADADLVCVVGGATGNRRSVDVARGPLAGDLEGWVFDPSASAAGRAEESAQPVRADADGPFATGSETIIGPTMAVPLETTDGQVGVLVISRSPGRPRFGDADLGAAVEFVGQVSVALRLAAGRVDRERLATLEDRSRIARDLHDHVIQRLFGAGLSLQALARSVPDEASRTKLTEQVDALDAAITEIRTAIFAMTSARDARQPSLRHRVIDLVGQMSDLFSEAPRVTFSGAVDLMVTAELADDISAVIREGLSNVARHASAHEVSVAVSLAGGVVSVEILDDGVGIDKAIGRSSGTINLARRAVAWKGAFVVAPRQPRGTRLGWSARVDEKEQ